MKPGHDGTIAVIDSQNKELVFSYESEKDNFRRYEALTPSNLIQSASQCDYVPDVIALSGWSKTSIATDSPIGAGYYGIKASTVSTKDINFFGKKVKLFSSSHERSHIWGTYGMSPYPQGEPVYLLGWEGALGDFYEITAELEVIHIGKVMVTPGNKYAFLYALADETFTLPKGKLRYEDPGKLMALCAFGRPGTPTAKERKLINFLLERKSILKSLAKDDLRDSPYYNIGVCTQEFTDLARRFSDELFLRFHSFAETHMKKGYPLLISGGCGLNCDWNTRWKESGLFSDVFVPPCANDTGSAIGTAVDAMQHYTGIAKINWSAYAGPAFVDDMPFMENVEVRDLDYEALARLIASGAVIAWTNGNCEIGPRALGNRSLLAAANIESNKARLNEIKGREDFRPIAPICLEEDVHEYFEWSGPSKYMLYFQRVKNRTLTAITHVDGTARVQTIARTDNEPMYDLLVAYRRITGTSVLCNTSLNFSGAGFINRTSDLYSYSCEKGLEGFVYNKRMCVIIPFAAQGGRERLSGGN